MKGKVFSQRITSLADLPVVVEHKLGLDDPVFVDVNLRSDVSMTVGEKISGSVPSDRVKYRIGRKWSIGSVVEDGLVNLSEIDPDGSKPFHAGKRTKKRPSSRSVAKSRD